MLPFFSKQVRIYFPYSKWHQTMLQLVQCNIIISGVHSSGMSRCLILEVHYWIILSTAKIFVAWVFDDWVRNTSGLILTGENQSIRRETCSRISLSPLIPRRLNWDRNQAFPVRDNFISTWFIAPPSTRPIVTEHMTPSKKPGRASEVPLWAYVRMWQKYYGPYVKKVWGKFISSDVCKTY
jgi:hypothetical protein